MCCGCPRCCTTPATCPSPGRTTRRSRPAIAAALDANIAAEHVGAAFGGLAAGFDILAVEALLRAGITPTAVLPCDPDTYEADSVAPAGERWVARFRALLPQRARHPAG